MKSVRNICLASMVCMLPINVAANDEGLRAYNKRKQDINRYIKDHPQLWVESRSVKEFLDSVIRINGSAKVSAKKPRSQS